MLTPSWLQILGAVSAFAGLGGPFTALGFAAVPAGAASAISGVLTQDTLSLPE